MKEVIQISVVIPMYNSSKTIIKVLNSVLSQTEVESIKEIIVVDDGSVDNSVDLVQKYKDKNKKISIRILKKRNGGVSSARNLGIKESKGNWIALLDSDDLWNSDKIEKQVKTIRANPQIDFLGCGTDNIPLKILWRKVDTLYKANIKDLCLKSFPATPTILFRKSIIDKVGCYDENQRYAEDGNFNMKVCLNYNYYYLPLSLVKLGFGKKPFGDKGLSSNMKGMYRGNVKNIKELRKNKTISLTFYLFLRGFYWMKYIRRLVIVFYHKRRKR